MVRYCFLGVLFTLFLYACSNNKQKSNQEAIDQIIQIHQDSSESYNALQQASNLLKHTNAPDSLIERNIYLTGKYFLNERKLDSAEHYLFKVIDFAKKGAVGNNQAAYFYQLWNLLLSQGRYGDCIALADTFESLIDSTQKENLGLLYFFRENNQKKIGAYNKALQHNESRIQVLSELNRQSSVIKAVIAQAELKYYSLGDKKGTFETLDHYLGSSEQLTHDHLRQLYGEYGVYLFYEKQYRKSIEHYKKGVFHTKKLKKDNYTANSLATGYANISEAFIELGEYESAKAYLDSVAQLAVFATNSSLQKSVLKYRARLALASKNDKEVLNSIDSIFSFQEKQYKTKFENELVALEKANENEKQLLEEKQEAVLKSIALESRQISIAIAVVLLLVILSFLYVRRKLKFEKEQLLMQQRLLRSQMNPHFTSNTLYAIQNLVKDNPNKAIQYLLTFSRVLRITLENSMTNYVKLEKELNSLKQYLDLQLLRFPEKFEYSIRLEEIEEDEHIFIPPMLLQPILENSIEHGFRTIDYLGELSITLSRKNKFILCKIEDNGLGIAPKTNGLNPSVSIQLISEFVEKMTKEKLVITNKSDIDKNDTGVIVAFKMPYKNH